MWCSLRDELWHLKFQSRQNVYTHLSDAFCVKEKLLRDPDEIDILIEELFENCGENMIDIFEESGLDLKNIKPRVFCVR